MPPVHVTGLMTGSISPELSGTSYIRSSSGYTTRISYTSKGWISGVPNSFSAVITKDGASKPIYTAEGQWSGEFLAKDARTGKTVMNLNTGALKRKELKVKPIEQQREWESRRAWRHVSEAINENDVLRIGKEKAKIENEQREMRRREKEQGKSWQRRFFKRVSRDRLAEELAGKLDDVKLEMPGGIWVWDEEKYRTEMGMKGSNDGGLLKSGVKSPTRTRWDSGVVIDGITV
ncbi:Oxysterol binding protein [Clarireedia jacksonii]